MSNKLHAYEISEETIPFRVFIEHVQGRDFTLSRNLSRKYGRKTFDFMQQADADIGSKDGKRYITVKEKIPPKIKSHLQRKFSIELNYKGNF